MAASQTFGNEMTVNHLAAQATSVQGQFFGVAHVGVGAGLETELNLINSHASRQAKFRISVVDDLGQAVAVPAEFVLQPHQQRVVDLSVLFELASTGVLIGSLEIELLDVFRGPYLFAPASTAQFSSRGWTDEARRRCPSFGCRAGRPSTPMWPRTRASLPEWPSRIGPMSAGVTVEAYDEPGNLVGETDFELGPGVRTAKLLSELIPATAGQSGGTFRVRSPDGAVESFASLATSTETSSRPSQGLNRLQRRRLPWNAPRHALPALSGTYPCRGDACVAL